MKNRFWIIVIAAIFVISAIIAVLQYTHKAPGQYAEIYQDGVLIQTVDLGKDAEFTITTTPAATTRLGQDGAISVVERPTAPINTVSIRAPFRRRATHRLLAQ
jgi:hypothetical protein